MDSHPPPAPALDPIAGVAIPSVPPWHASSDETPVEGAEESLDPIALRTVALADRLLREARANQSRQERYDAELLARLMDDTSGKAFTVAVVDQVFRSADPAAQARRWRELLHRHGAPEFVTAFDRFLMRMSAVASHAAPGT